MCDLQFDTSFIEAMIIGHDKTEYRWLSGNYILILSKTGAGQ